MKIIFLDVDGVLNSSNFFIETKEAKKGLSQIERNIDVRTLPHLKQIIEETGAKVVISSTWRGGHPDFPLYVDLINILKDNGADVIGITPPKSESGHERGNEIRDWLSAHDDVEAFVILDDDCDMCEFTDTHLVRTAWFDGYGLSEKHAKKAIKILNEASALG